MMKKMGAGILGLVAAMGLAGAAQANAGWELIGFKTVAAHTDTDVIRVNPGREFRMIQICSFDAPTHMIDVDIWFRNGEHQDVDLRAKLRRGTCSRAIDLRGGDRHITEIRLRYARVHHGRVPLIRVMGRD